MGYFNHAKYVEMTVHFRCNLMCEHCMIEGTMDTLEPESIETLYEVIDHNRKHKQWTGIIFTGSEVTLWKGLPRFVEAARKNGFDNVRIQTHGMRLADKQYAESLISAGVNEFFISITAGDRETHDSITKVDGSFVKTMEAFDVLDAMSDILLISNTVITSRSYKQLSQIVDNLAHLKKLIQMDFWNYWPMSESDDRDLIVEHLELLPYIQSALTKAMKLGRHIELKNYPECLLGPLRDGLVNDQPKLYIDDEFWNEFSKNGFHQCVYKDQCQPRQCLGLNTAYIQKHGWHEKDLVPFIDTPVSSNQST